MSFGVVLQRNNSEQNRMDKSVETILTATGTLKSGTSIINPVILLSADISSLTETNYLTISTFNRSYFITNIKSIRENLVEVSARVDVISSFADAIRSNTAIIRRQENTWNLHINDGSLHVYHNPRIVTKSFTGGFSGLSFVLAIAGS